MGVIRLYSGCVLGWHLSLGQVLSFHTGSEHRCSRPTPEKIGRATVRIRELASISHTLGGALNRGGGRKHSFHVSIVWYAMPIYTPVLPQSLNCRIWTGSRICFNSLKGICRYNSVNYKHLTMRQDSTRPTSALVEAGSLTPTASERRTLIKAEQARRSLAVRMAMYVDAGGGTLRRGSSSLANFRLLRYAGTRHQAAGHLLPALFPQSSACPAHQAVH
jgi:hypothetical protein